jgi:hypothetical protein
MAWFSRGEAACHKMVERIFMSFITRCRCTAAIIALAAIGIQACFAEDTDNRAQRLARLEAGIRAEEAIRAVKRLQHTYGHYLSLGLWNDLADLFTENATGQFQTGTVKVQMNLRKYFMQQAGRTLPGLAQGQLNTHLLLQPIITLGPDAKTAKGTWHEMALLGKFGSSASWLGGVYENEYAVEKGVWKISRLRFFPQYSGSYEEWGHKAPPKWDIPYHFDAAHVGITIPQSALQPSGSSKVPTTAPITQLSRRVRRLNDETQVQNLQHSYGYYLDRKMWDDIADLFTDDGALEDAQRGVYIGKARIRRALEVFYGPSPLRRGELFDHINLATVVTVAPDGRSAAARTSQLSMLGLNWEYAQWEVGTYENEFVKEDGVWKIKAVHYYPRMTTEYDKGWAVDAIPAPGENQDFPPDRPSMSACASYPRICYVAFHYANPGTGRTVRYPAGTVAQVQSVKQPAPSARETGVVPDNANLDLIVAALENRLAAAIAVDAVENLNSSYGYYIDESAWDNMADTFAGSGSKEITGVGVYVGRERIRKVLNLRGPRGGRTPDFFTIHQLTQPVIHISADGVSANARLRLVQCGGNADGSSGSWIGGIYENTAVKENGEWKFGAQDLHHIFNASYRNGWARVGRPPHQDGQTGRPPAGREVPGGGIQQGLGGAAMPNRFAREFPPDRPIRSKQYAFPEIVEPAFHYRNPVTGRIPPQLLK